MESTPPENKPIYRTNYLGSAIAVVIAFMVGIYVGLHPLWIPIHTADTVSPDSITSPNTQMSNHEEQTGSPQTAPSTLPTTQN